LVLFAQMAPYIFSSLMESNTEPQSPAMDWLH
jgi:hypothetical protein